MINSPVSRVSVGPGHIRLLQPGLEVVSNLNDPYSQPNELYTICLTETMPDSSLNLNLASIGSIPLETSYLHREVIMTIKEEGHRDQPILFLPHMDQNSVNME